MFAPAATGPIKAINLAEVRDAARRKLPRLIFDLIDGGAEGETTLAANERQFADYCLIPRQAAPVRGLAATRVLGDELSFPILLAPCGAARFVHPEGELALARAAAAAGTGYVVPHVSGHSMEAVRAQAPHAPAWYQLYKLGGKLVAERAIDRAAEAGFQKLVVTIDNNTSMRERDVRNGMSALLSGSLRHSLPYWGQFATRLGWLGRYLAARGLDTYPNIVTDGRAMRFHEIAAANSDPESRFSWRDIAWVRERWRGPLVVKSVLCASDARRAVDLGADGVIVSNHGGRALDHAPATLHVLPEVVEAVGPAAAVLLDGGIRRASDAIKAIAMGASGVLIGRPAMFGLAFGEAGVNQVIEILKRDFVRTLEAIGCAEVTGLGPEFVRRR